MDAIFPFFQWCETTWIFHWVESHEVAYPALETIHLFGLTLLLGTTVLLCLRVLGLLMKRQPVAEFSRELSPYTYWGLSLMVVSGLTMFVATAVRCYGNTSFWIKMALFATALLFHFLYFRKLVRRDDASIGASAKVAAVVTLLLWFGVGAAGRSIGFFG